MSIESILINNYKKINDPNIIPNVIDEINKWEENSLYNFYSDSSFNDFIHIKRLTKVGTNILKTNQLDRKTLTNLYNLHLFGIDLIRQDNFEGKKKKTSKTCESHLLGHNEDVCLKLFEKTKNSKYLYQAAKFREKAGEISLEIGDLKYGFYSFQYAGKYYKKKFELERNEKKKRRLIKKAADCKKKAYEIAKTMGDNEKGEINNLIHSSDNYRMLSNLFKDRIKKELYLNKSIGLRKKLLKISNDFKDTKASLNCIAKCYSRLAKNEFENENNKYGILYSLQSIKYFEKLNELAIDNGEIALFYQTNSFLADVYQKLSDFSDNRIFKRKARINYNNFINFYSTEKNMEKHIIKAKKKKTKLDEKLFFPVITTKIDNLIFHYNNYRIKNSNK